MKLDPYLRGICALVIWAGSLFAALGPVHADAAPTTQSPERILDEARTVYLGNLKRREDGKAPLKWNYQLTQSARWFSWDASERRAAGFCAHDDSEGHLPDWRTVHFGYKGKGGAENAYCGMLPPEDAINGWMDSPGHRVNLLSAGHQEVGIGYYFNGTRGFVTQDFGTDPDFTPLIINNEAITTTTAQVNLYLHNRTTSSVYGLGSTIDFRVSNSMDFGSAAWQAYAADTTWTLPGGNGWHTVYVQTRDAMKRMAIISDTIYVGEEIPLSELGDAMMSSTQGSVLLSNLKSDNASLDLIQFAPGWAMDNTENPQISGGVGGVQADDKAWGNSTFCLQGGSGQSSARIWTADFVPDVPMQAYFRVRASDNSMTGEAARLRVTAGTNTTEPLILNGTQFSQANTYQEFRIPFTYHKSGDQVFLMFEFWRSSTADICLDAVSIFPDPTPMSSEMTVTVPDGNYRGQMLWGRYANKAGQFSTIKDFNPLSKSATPPPTPTPAPTFTVTSKVYLASMNR